MTSPNQREFALQVVETLQLAGFEALWAGGCVRDQLLGRQPNDYDVATSAKPDEIRQLFGHKKTLAIGASFGVITVLGPKSAGQVDVATFRTDAGYSDGRHPDSVTFSTAEKDAQRRDFTINGLFFDPITQRTIDYVGGLQDLEKNLLRAIGDPHQRISEDKLRMLRAVRFAATFDLEIDPGTLAAVLEHRHEISVVSQERIGAEIRKMFGHQNRHLAYQWLETTRLLGLVVECLPPSANKFAGFTRSPQNCFETLLRLPNEADHCLATAGLLVFYRDKRSEVENVCRDLKWSNHETEKTAWIHQQLITFAQADQLKWSELQPLLVNDWASEVLTLGEAACDACRELATGIEFCRQQLKLPAEELNPKPFLDGKILKEIGIEPGPKFKTILDETRAAQLDGTISSKNEAIEVAKSLNNEL